MRHNLHAYLQTLNHSIGTAAIPLPAGDSIERLVAHLRRVLQCANIDTLTGPFLQLERLRVRVERLHEATPVAGILKVRKAIDGIESFLETVPLSAPRREPPPCALLDLPNSGLLHRILDRKPTSRRPSRKTKAADARRPVTRRGTMAASIANRRAA
jgi:hypothetical protein